MFKEHMPFRLTLADFQDLGIIAKDLTFCKVLKERRETRASKADKALKVRKEKRETRGILDYKVNEAKKVKREIKEMT